MSPRLSDATANRLPDVTFSSVNLMLASCDSQQLEIRRNGLSLDAICLPAWPELPRLTSRHCERVTFMSSHWILICP
jgi:hypothetical protein